MILTKNWSHRTEGKQSLAEKPLGVRADLSCAAQPVQHVLWDMSKMLKILLPWGIWKVSIVNSSFQFPSYFALCFHLYIASLVLDYMLFRTAAWEQIYVLPQTVEIWCKNPGLLHYKQWRRIILPDKVNTFLFHKLKCLNRNTFSVYFTLSSIITHL